MKNLKYVLAVVFATLLFSSCKDDLNYEGSPRIKFDRYVEAWSIVEPIETLNLQVQLVGKPLSTDVTVQVNVISDKTTARAGTDYSMPSTVVIPAGSNVATLTITGYFDGLDDGTADSRTLAIELIGPNGVPSITSPISVSNSMGVNTHTLTLRKLCGFVPEDFEGFYDVLDKSGYEPDPYPIYEVEVTLVSKAGSVATYIVDGLWGENIPVEFTIDGTDLFNITVSIPEQEYDVDATYGQMWFAQRSQGKVDACDLIISTNYQIFVAAGWFDQVVTSVWTKK